MTRGVELLRGVRATRAFVDLDAIAANVTILREHLPERTRLMAVVKADAYGHGAPWVAATAIEAGAAMLGVATVSEAHRLRAHGISAPIVLLGPIEPDEAPLACQLGLEITVANERLLAAVQESAAGLREPTAVHVKIDTGLRRYGASCEEAIELVKRIIGGSDLRLAGVFTHFASADEPLDQFSDEQIGRFKRVIDDMVTEGIPAPPRHIANSASVLTYRGAWCEIARPGIAMYGVPPSDEVPLWPGMRPALRIESRIARVVPINLGDSVGYNRTFRSDHSMRGALLPIGYADGYRRALAGKGWVGLQGLRAPVLGRVSMDQTVVQVPDELSVEPGDVVYVMGGDPELGAPSVADMAAMMQTNAYEVLVSIRQRIPRVFTRNHEVVAVRTAGDPQG